MSPHDISILRKIMPIICILVPWEVYYYIGDYSKGWGIKFSLFYANFDSQYGNIFVDMIKQLGLLSYGGFLPSVRTITWFVAAILCIALLVYELSKKSLELELKNSNIAAVFIACAILTLVSSLAVWNSAFKAFPIAPFFFSLGGYLLLTANDSSEKFKDNN